MKAHNSIALVALMVTVLISCKKDKGNSGGPTPPPAACKLISETTNLPGNTRTWNYVYDAKGLTTVKSNAGNGGTDQTYEIQSSLVVVTQLSNINWVYAYQTSDLQTGHPFEGHDEIHEGIMSRVAWYYEFGYDAQGRLNDVKEFTDFPGDAEWGVSIIYNDNSNVSELRYYWHAGPKLDVPPIVITGYDDKPSPYANIKGWQFYKINYGWDSSDPEALLSALSKNNPTGFTTGAGSTKYTIKMDYTYNDAGFPTIRNRTNTNSNGTISYTHTYTYECP